jgi:ribosome biogenesis GTPase
VSGVERSLIDTESERGSLTSRLTGKLLRESKEGGSPVTVGDWVLLREGAGSGPAAVQAILPRKTVLERKRAISGGRRIRKGELVGGRTQAQAVAANIDLAFLVAPLREEAGPGEGFSRIERSMTLCAAGGIQAAIVYNKADLVDPDGLPLILECARSLCPNVLAVSAKQGTGIGELRSMMGEGRGRSAVFFGPSGAGKSSLINALMADDQGRLPEGFRAIDTGPLSQATGKGLHTTTSRGLYLLPSGGIVIDSPGMRELALWAGQEDLDEAFADIAALAAECRFSDCRHRTEPGCRVRAALESGELEERRFENWRRMHGEVERLDMRKIALYTKAVSKAKRYFDADHR